MQDRQSKTIAAIKKHEIRELSLIIKSFPYGFTSNLLPEKSLIFFLSIRRLLELREPIRLYRKFFFSKIVWKDIP
ncbi:hypothetical protein LEP1GSC047_4201 [Leptospira inadai serovar Lyme str. 10]|uniref:Uncharacterized protein n=1 Tax=Leptospira inadai serovar Lyme str. 10 TaxID=1049790 RepID=V6HEC1_9LEPT|nr:hypothetical protein LEP1GSC047_4201 [Leptospira inadai serovar Lyme str. 10]